MIADKGSCAVYLTLSLFVLIGWVRETAKFHILLVTETDSPSIKISLENMTDGAFGRGNGLRRLCVETPRQV